MISDVLRAPDLTVGLGQAVAVVLLTAILLVLRHLLSQESVVASLGWSTPNPGPFRWPLCGRPREVATHRLLAAILLGVPAVGLGFILFGLSGPLELTFREPGAVWAIGSGVVTAATLASFMAYISRWPDMCNRYPAMRPSRWTNSVTFLDVSTWAVYLATYEFLMRGLLLGALASAVGPLPALIATIIIDAMAHGPQGRQETIGSAGSAALFGILALATGGIMAPFIAHWAMAVSIDFCCARHRSKDTGY